jgi:heat shock protein HslJ
MLKSCAGCVLVCVLVIAGCHATGTRPPTAAQLAGSRWNVLLIDDEPVRPSRPTLEFLDQAKISGYAGCNGYTGKVHVSGKSTRLIDVSSTLVGCQDTGVMEQEQRFLGALTTVRAFRYESGRLALLDAAGKTRLLLEQDLSEPGPRSPSRRVSSVIATPTVPGASPYASSAEGGLASASLPNLRNYRLQSLKLVTVTADLGAYFGADHGALVVEAPPENYFGLKEGDVVLSVNGRKPATGEHALRILGSYKPLETLSFEVMRQHQPVSYQITLPR